MTKVSFLYSNLIILLIILYSEFFFFNIHTYIIKNVKNLKLNLLKINYRTTWNSCSALVTLTYFILYFITYKYCSVYFLFKSVTFKYFWIHIIFFFFFFFFFKLFKSNQQHTILFFISFFFYSFILYYINNLINFLFLMELYSAIYYFFFLSINQSNIYSIVKYKHFLLFFLINSFFTNMFYSLSCLLIINEFGTLNFNELNLFTNFNNIGLLLLFLSFCWKIGTPYFHLFKLEIYKYIDPLNSILYSLITIFYNFILIIFLLQQNFILKTLAYFNVYIIFLIMSGIMSCFFFRIKTFYEFIAFSSILTLSILILLFIL